ncbi:sensor domain-containing diguanylate cyclase [Anaerotardibacter muris]|uniref:sensor domain-containing diguanylate cyclase n=1 Tax=Anaerotardibacter muris TaxID=2941505 RepID=UPI002041CE2E|nr:diguanylate cyclase [Anaerotardibacter muris]
MYHKTLHISLFGTSDEVNAAIRATEPLRCFTHDIVAFPAFDAHAFARCDIAIIDARAWQEATGEPLMPARDLAAATEALKQAHGDRFWAVVAIAPKELTNTWSQEDFSVLSLLWSAPLSSAEAAFQFSALQRAAQTRSDLILSETYFNTLINSMPSMVWVKRVDGTHLKVNDFFCSVVNKAKEDIEGQGHNYIWNLPPEDTESAEMCAETERQAIAAGETREFEEQVESDRGRRLLITYKTPLYDEDGSVMGTIGTADDVTELDNLRYENDILLNSLPLAVIVEDKDETILNINATTEVYFQQTRENTVGMNFSAWRRIAFGEELARIREKHESAELFLDRGGIQRLMYMRKAPIRDVFGNRTGQVRIYSDMTELRQLEQQAMLNARTDYLTGLFNRRYFYEHLDDFDESSSAAIAIFDLDNFKDVNDTLGHAIGDHVLILVSEVLQEVFPDSQVIRWGGDEFVVAMFGIDDVDVMRERAQRALELFEARSTEPGEPWKICGSCGIAFSPTIPNPIDPLVQRADAALYDAKNAGKGVVRVSE